MDQYSNYNCSLEGTQMNSPELSRITVLTLSYISSIELPSTSAKIQEKG